MDRYANDSSRNGEFAVMGFCAREMAGEKGGDRNGDPPLPELVRRRTRMGGIGSVKPSADDMRLKPSRRSERADGDCVRAMGCG